MQDKVAQWIIANPPPWLDDTMNNQSTTKYTADLVLDYFDDSTSAIIASYSGGGLTAAQTANGQNKGMRVSCPNQSNFGAGVCGAGGEIWITEKMSFEVVAPFRVRLRSQSGPYVGSSITSSNTYTSAFC